MVVRPLLVINSNHQMLVEKSNVHNCKHMMEKIALHSILLSLLILFDMLT
jgi:hypothetical protein